MIEPSKQTIEETGFIHQPIDDTPYLMHHVDILILTDDLEEI